MKIGIITQPLSNNYGGLLQNYALQQVLKSMGHEVETVDWLPNKSMSLYEVLWQLKERLLCLIQKDRPIPHYKLTNAEEAVIGCNTRHFTSCYINTCPQKVYCLEDFGQVDNKYKYDAYVVGSDQVWRPSYNSVMMPAMFLGFTNRTEVRRIAYAASFGTSEWEFYPQLTETCAQLAKNFDIITVREKSGVQLCKDYLGVEAAPVLDPTMLLDSEAYEKIVMAENEHQSSGNLFHYILDPSSEKKDLIKKVAEDKGLQPFTIMPKYQAENRTKRDVKNRIEDCVFPSVTSWLRGFMDAKMVIVDSFHGAVFSIIFNKPFWVIGNSKRGNARFESLLELYGLQDRMISPYDEIDWNREINWAVVNAIRQEKAIESKSVFDILNY